MKAGLVRVFVSAQNEKHQKLCLRKNLQKNQVAKFDSAAQILITTSPYEPVY